MKKFEDFENEKFSDPEFVKAVREADNKLVIENYKLHCENEDLLAENEKLKAKLDMARGDLESTGICDFCSMWDFKNQKCKKKSKCHWQWRGDEE